RSPHKPDGATARGPRVNRRGLVTSTGFSGPVLPFAPADGVPKAAWAGAGWELGVQSRVGGACGPLGRLEPYRRFLRGRCSYMTSSSSASSFDSLHTFSKLARYVAIRPPP